eukprot:comp23114_c0_seq1/m.37220 comp23114_c0_seq1/g.37220  ORF comp23114_c0_seq1/g.37220 comp23114_c0_seq1/m.37220 type:complete len:320 (-) comp23114_c0_seq1:109-1068(-)
MWSRLRSHRRAGLLGCSALTLSLGAVTAAYLTTTKDEKNHSLPILSSLSSLLFPSVVHADARLANDLPTKLEGTDYMHMEPRTYTSAWDDNWDHRKHQKPKTPPPAPSSGDQSNPESSTPAKKKRVARHIYLIRHGQYVNGPDDKVRILSELGREQAATTGKRLAATPIKFDRLVMSTMTRATETATLIHEHIPSVKTESCDLLREGAPMVPIPPTLSGWRPDESDFFIDGARIETAFRTYFYRPDPEQTESTHEIIVCHGNVIRYFVCRALQIPPECWLRMSLAHCSITRIDCYNNGRVVVRSVGDMGHLSHEQQTFV